MSAPPDASVIVAVYNTLPYLTTCLDSLLAQTIGADRMEIIAIDDGSTDGSGKELDRYAALYPGRIHVLRQPNSGGPAAPSNRGLDVATGRYVHFVGADDHLGTEALERLVTAADTWGSDVVVGRMAGVNGRYVHERLFSHDTPAIDPYESQLPWTLSNCKLFRRDLIERHGLRFREDLPVYGDLPFTLATCHHARRVSVLAGYTCYYAVLRDDRGNITRRASASLLLECTTKVVESTAALLPPGDRRDAVMRRHFGGELDKLLREHLLESSGAERHALVGGVGAVAARYLSAGVLGRVRPRARLRLELARLGETGLLCRALQDERDGVEHALFLDGDRMLTAAPGLGDPRLPDACFAVTGDVGARIRRGLWSVRALWADRDGGPGLSVEVRTRLTGPGAGDPRQVWLGLVPVRRGRDLAAPRRLTDWKAPPRGCVPALGDDPGGVVRGLFALAPLLAPKASHGGRWAVRLYVAAGGAVHEIPVPAGPDLPQQRRLWRRGRPLRLAAMASERGGLTLAVAPIRPSRVVRGRLRRLLARRVPGEER